MDKPSLDWILDTQSNWLTSPPPPKVKQVLKVKEVKKAKLNLPPNRLKKKSVFSLTSIKEKKELLKKISENEPEEIDKPKKIFSENDFLLVWKEYCQKIEKDGKFN